MDPQATQPPGTGEGIGAELPAGDELTESAAAAPPEDPTPAAIPRRAVRSIELESIAVVIEYLVVAIAITWLT